MITESVQIKALDNRNVYVDHYDDDVWLSIQTSAGSANCVIPMAEAQKMFNALKELLASREARRQFTASC